MSRLFTELVQPVAAFFINRTLRRRHMLSLLLVLWGIICWLVTAAMAAR